MRSLRTLSLLIAAAALLPQAAGAAPEEGAISLEDAVARALAQQPDLKVADAKVGSAEAQVDRARVARRPTVDLSAGAGAQPGSGAFAGAGLNAGLDASILLYDFGKSRVQIEAAQAGVASAREDELDARATVAFHAAQAYYTLWAAQEVVSLSEEALKEAEARVKTAQALYD